MSATRLVIAGGGTGGHLFPGIAVAEALLELEPEAEVLFVGTERGIEKTAVPKAGFNLELIEVSGLKRVGLATRLRTLLNLPLAHLASARILRQFGATAVIGVGGYASGPVVMTAKMLGIPTAICEQNSVPGLTNRILGRVVRKVFATFPSSASFFPAPSFELVGNPVRASFRRAAERPADEVEAGLVFTFGGSQGARPLNQTVPKALGVLKARGRSLKALHQAGKVDGPDVEAGYRQAEVEAEVVSFIDDMVAAYRRADVVICRAGATSCSELTALGVPAILVPFPQAADDHQTKNAADLVDGGAAILMPQSEMTPERLADAIENLLDDRDRRGDMAEASRRLGKLDAALDVARSAQQGFPRARVPRLLTTEVTS
jgi:UDP-N-acetylglucosamine--N-acetylmuramyl-(pentapeptide) pyrophosphoryl-undecaprenol N-acetylglucosamine transferase